MAKLQKAQKSYGACLGKNLVYGDFTGADATFTITGGPILLQSLGFMVTTLMAGTNTLQFRFTVTDGSITNLCTAADTDAAAVGQLFVITGAAGESIVKTTAVGYSVLADQDTLPIVLSTGTIYMTWSASSTAGAGVAFMQYTPLSQFTNVSIA